jgi:hypothetical protein
MTLPRLCRVRQSVPRAELADAFAAARNAAAALVTELPRESRIAVCVGSRGISQIGPIVAHVIARLKELGHQPFVLAAMGSHGGATAAGQRGVLTGLGVTEEAVSARVITEERSVVVGKTDDGLDVFVNPVVRDVAGIILVGRVKPHTSMRPPLGSGLCKMLAVGLGNPSGAKMLHGAGLAQQLHRCVAVLRKELPLLGGIAIVEDGAGSTAHVEAVAACDLEKKDHELLVLARGFMPSIPVEPIDVLVVSTIGKDISGAGMDPNIIGTHRRLGGDPDRLISTIGVLGLTDASQGNATGIGMADITTEAMVRRIDWDATRTNCTVSGFAHGCQLPVIAANDRALFETALAPYAERRLALIYDTKSLDELWISENLLGAAQRPLEPLGPAREIPFDEEGRLRIDALEAP